jgi:hypothetical protein
MGTGLFFGHYYAIIDEGDTLNGKEEIKLRLDIPKEYKSDKSPGQ